VAPLDLGGVQRSVAFQPVNGHWASRSVVPCGFMRLRGTFAGPERIHVLDRETRSGRHRGARRRAGSGVGA
jgi:protein-L-isoaspartate(D-aspartate) O-methyltransferase